MADAWIGIDEPGTIDKRVDCENLTVAATSVYRERMQIAGTVDVEIVDVTNADPGASDYALVTRDIGPAMHARNDAFAAAYAIGGELDDTAPVAATEGNVSPLRITAQRAAHVNLRANDGTELATTAAPLGVQIGDGTDTAVVSAAGGLSVEVTTALPAGTNNIGDIDVLTVPAPLSTTGGGTEAAALRVTIANDSTGLVSVDDGGGALTVDGSVSLAAAIPAGTNNIGDVDVVTLPALPAGTNNIGDVDIASFPAAALEVVGDVAHDAAAAGNPVLIGAVARTTEPAAVSAAADLSQLMTDLIGKLVVLPYATPDAFVTGAQTLTATGDTAVIAAGGAGVRNYITSVSGSNTSATGVRVDIKDGTTVLMSFFCAASGGGFAHSFPTPIRGTAATAVNFAISAAVTDVRVSAQGYRSAA